jgi:hypothetical protein
VQNRSAPGKLRRHAARNRFTVMLYLAFIALSLSGAAVFLSLTVLMALFLGWENAMVDRSSLLLGVLGGFAAIAGACCLPGLRHPDGSIALGVWRRTPAWLVVSQATLVVLAALAWLSIWLAEYTSGETVRPGHGTPVVVILLATVAFAAAYAQIVRQLSPQALGGPQRYAGPDRSDAP